MSRRVGLLEEEIENIEGHLNAYTSSEQATYVAYVMEKVVSRPLDALADVLQISIFSEDMIA